MHGADNFKVTYESKLNLLMNLVHKAKDKMKQNKLI